MLPSKQILFIGTNSRSVCQDLIGAGYVGLAFPDVARTQSWLSNHMNSKKRIPDIMLCDFELPDGDAFAMFLILKELQLHTAIQFIILSSTDNNEIRKKAHFLGVDDFFLLPLEAKEIQYRLQYISTAKVIDGRPADELFEVPRIPLFKRLFDIAVSGTALFILSPFLLLIALLIKLDSPGPVLYISRRAGYNYKIFKFYKFRSMRINADQELQRLTDLNQYNNSSFIKIKNDPRITKLGAFLRNTSLDELPQLFNVLQGDMSLVGNRPLPLYEAENLTTDEWALRFMAPAGITGLWQVTKRGQENMTDLERKNLDLQYANNQSYLMDYEIFMKTFSALRQKENV